jgi:hypothetical protein
VKATANGQSGTINLTTRRPYQLVAGAISDTCSATYGYEDFLSYTIEDQLSTPLPSSVPINENWTTGIINDYSGTNWRRGPAGSYTTPSDASFADDIGGENITGGGFTPIPTPGCGSGSTAVEHWGQSWYVGTTANGSGARVQSDTLQKYQDHAVHNSIVSPNP